MGCEVWGVRCGVWGGVWGAGCGVWGFRFGIGWDLLARLLSHLPLGHVDGVVLKRDRVSDYLFTEAEGKFPQSGGTPVLPPAGPHRQLEGALYGQPAGLSPLNHQDNSSGPALRHGSLNSLFQVA